MTVPAPIPSLGLSLGISPSSNAQSNTSADSGSDMQSFAPVFSKAPIDWGGTSETPISGLIRDGALIVALAIAARWIWGKL